MSKGNAQRITSFYRKSLTGEGHPADQLVAYQTSYFQALANMDAITAKQIIQDAIDAKIPPGTIMLEVFCSVMDRFGELQANQKSPFQKFTPSLAWGKPRLISSWCFCQKHGSLQERWSLAPLPAIFMAWALKLWPYFYAWLVFRFMNWGSMSPAPHL